MQNYPFIIFAVNTISLLNKVFHFCQIAFFGCIMQANFLMERRKYIAVLEKLFLSAAVREDLVTEKPCLNWMFDILKQHLSDYIFIAVHLCAQFLIVFAMYGILYYLVSFME